MPATVLQINVSRGGLPKRPLAEGVVTPLGLEGDSCAHPQIHGGPKQALLLVTRETVDELKERGYSLFYGALGENLTTSGLDRRLLRAGQQYRIGSEVIVELTRPRVPCDALDVFGEALRHEIWDKGIKAGDVSSVRWGMSGFYARVIRGGHIAPGAPIQLLQELA